ncbi:FtsX-like permease family protein [Streptomyces sp. DvalAA-14]|uniref:FtsX-like permease family protein n=1 Tax=unclassified Streptomyces TaxID=2593676 RepID=UPI00081AF815|nr:MULTISPECIES: FtsX-like permease family protein [unclassified Streptomyces]MYS22181.1 ABC transporter permease [Streptomyces sp. SID4948]SCE10312.1 FtsX-like permease family protein [Streptomyces sp. DvalAA-14]
MIRLGVRLTLSGGKDAIARLVIVAAAVALGVGLLLGVLAALNATGTQDARNAWLNTGTAGAAGPTGPARVSGSAGESHPAAGDGAAVDPLWWMLRADSFDGKVIGRVDLAATGPRSPVPPGIPRLPGPGEFYASPALIALLDSTPAAELAARYPGHLIGAIGDAALPGPDSLIVVVGRRPDQLAAGHRAERVTSITDASPSRCDGSQCVVAAGTDSNGMKLILSVVAVALIFPVLVLIGTATRLSAARREQRFASMRLVGATPRQVSVIAAVESALAAAAGTAGGFGLFFLIRPLLARISFTTTPFFVGDLSLSAGDVLLVTLGVPVAAAVSARIALRRVRISPLGVARRVTPRPPRAHRMIPLAAGLLELAYFIGRDPKTSDGQIRAFVPGILLVMGGIVHAGPWLTMVGARLMARRTSRPARLVAGRRLSDDPKAGFRAVSGLVLALCVTSTAVGVITSMVAERGIPHGSGQIRSTVIGQYQDFDAGGRLIGTAASPSGSLLAALRSVPGVRGVTVIHTDPHADPDPGPGLGGGLADCAQLATTPVFGTCPAGARTATVNDSFSVIGLQDRGVRWPAVWPAARSTPEQLRTLPVQQIVVTTDGTTPAVERARTVLAAGYPDQRVPFTIAEDRARISQQLDGYQQLSGVVIAVSFPIAGCGLAVSVAGGLSDRRRPFGLLRLTGVRLAVLRRVVLLESAVPLFVVAAVAIGTGLLAAQLFLEAQLGYSLRPPGGEYYLMVAGGLTAALAVIAATLPLLRRITGPETARNE